MSWELLEKKEFLKRLRLVSLQICVDERNIVQSKKGMGVKENDRCCRKHAQMRKNTVQTQGFHEDRIKF
jgi:hypothetical protein